MNFPGGLDSKSICWLNWGPPVKKVFVAVSFQLNILFSISFQKYQIRQEKFSQGLSIHFAVSYCKLISIFNVKFLYVFRTIIRFINREKNSYDHLNPPFNNSVHISYYSTIWLLLLVWIMSFEWNICHFILLFT